MQNHCLICRIECPKLSKNSNKDENSDEEKDGHNSYKLYEKLSKIVDVNRPHRLPETDLLPREDTEFRILCQVCSEAVKRLWEYQKIFEEINHKMNTLILTIKTAIQLQSNYGLTNYGDDTLKSEPLSPSSPLTDPLGNNNEEEEAEMETDNHNLQTYLEEESVLCHLCPARFKSDRVLESHVKRDHEGQVPSFLCPKCPMKFPIKFSLNRHLLMHDQDENQDEKSGGKNLPILCQVCQLPFKTKASRSGHWRRIHSTKPGVKCSVCLKTFQYERELKRHFLTHTGEKPYACPKCGKKFVRRTCITPHMNSKGCPFNNKTGEHQKQEEIAPDKIRNPEVGNDEFNPEEILS